MFEGIKTPESHDSGHSNFLIQFSPITTETNDN